MLKLEPNIVFADRYTLVEQIGHGGFSEVWKVKRASGFVQAIKIFITLDEEGVASARREFEKMFDLNHQRILTATDFGVWEGYPYLIMPYCKHGSAIKKIGKISEKELMKVLGDIASALTYLHGLNNPVIHQDIKPDNFLIDNHGNYLLSDFGISKHIKKRLSIQLPANRMTQTMNKGGMQTTGFAPPSYRPPESFSKELDQRKPVKASDIWALGTTMFEMATNELPFGELGGAIQNTGIETPNLPKEKFSREFNQLLHWCLQKETWDRPRATQLKEIAEHYLATGEYKGLQKEETIILQHLVSPRLPQEGKGHTTITQGATGAIHAGEPQLEKKKTNWFLPFLLFTILITAGFGYYAITTLMGKSTPDPIGQKEEKKSEKPSDMTGSSSRMSLFDQSSTSEEDPKEEEENLLDESVDETSETTRNTRKNEPPLTTTPEITPEITPEKTKIESPRNVSPPVREQSTSTDNQTTSESASWSDQFQEKAVEVEEQLSVEERKPESEVKKKEVTPKPKPSKPIPTTRKAKEETLEDLDIKTSNRIRNSKMKIRLTPDQELLAKDIRKGQEVKFTVSSDTRMQDYLFVRKGTPLVGKVSVASKGKKGMVIKFESLQLATGTQVKLRSVVLKNQRSNARFEKGKSYDLSFKIRAEKELDKYIGRLARK